MMKTSRFRTRDELENEGFNRFIPIINQLNVIFPQLRIKEMALGQLLDVSCLLALKVPSKNDKLTILDVLGLGYELDRDLNAYRLDKEAYRLENHAHQRIKCQAQIFTALLREDSYVGQLLQYLIALIKSDFHMLQHLIIYEVLNIGGARLCQVYPAQMRKILDSLLLRDKGYIDVFHRYINSPAL